jgi:nucleoside-diphosphate-sugar epimerase
MSVLVTGGTGFIGSRVVRALCARGEDVVVLDIRPNRERIADVARPVKVLVGTTRSVDDIIRIIQDYKIEKIADLVFALSPRGWPFPQVRDMAMGITNELEAARLCGLKRVLSTSSSAVAGPQSAYGNRPINEDEIAHGRSSYAALKILNERVARDYNHSFGMSNALVRVCHAWGPGPEMRGMGNINTIATYPAVGKPVTLSFQPQDWFVPSYVDDLAEIFCRLLYAEKLEHVVYWGGGPAYTWEQMTDTVKEFIPDAQIAFEGRAREQETYLIDCTRTRTELGFEFRALRDGVQELINLARGQVGMPSVG